MMSGGDLFKLQKIGGWQSTEMVMRYSHLSPSAFEDVFDLFGTPEEIQNAGKGHALFDTMKG